MRKCLEKEFPTESLGLGGVFCAKKGQLKIHVMPEFSTKPLELDSDVENWLNFYTMDSNFTCFSVFVSRDPVRPKPFQNQNQNECGFGQNVMINIFFSLNEPKKWLKSTDPAK